MVSRCVPDSETFFFSMILRPTFSTLFPYTTLFRSVAADRQARRRRPRDSRGGRGVAVSSEDQSRGEGRSIPPLDRKSTRLNSSHTVISYAVFCLKKKKN